MNPAKQNPTAFAESPAVEPAQHREECYRCFRAASVCICDQIPRVSNQTGVIILQHHRELLHPIGTARIARLGLERVQVRIARRSSQLAVAATIPARTALLYPHPLAKDLTDLSPEEFPKHLIVLDGTWSQAHSMYRANHWLHDLPHLVIAPQESSNYRIRRQPREGCLSTIEALVQALETIEPSLRGTREFLRVFDAMVDQQLAYRNS